MAYSDEHIIRRSECGQGFIVKDTVNNGGAFLSHLKLDHGITYIVQQMTKAKIMRKSTERQIDKPNS